MLKDCKTLDAYGETEGGFAFLLLSGCNCRYSRNKEAFSQQKQTNKQTDNNNHQKWKKKKKKPAKQTKLISSSASWKTNFWLCVNEAAVETWVNRRAQLIFTESIGTSDTEISKLWRCVRLGYWFTCHLPVVSADEVGVTLQLSVPHSFSPSFGSWAQNKVSPSLFPS